MSQLPAINQNPDYDESDDGTGLVTEIISKIKVPTLYRVVLLNDDFTPMDFVVDVIVRHFKKTTEAASEIMLQIHNEGRGVCGVFPHEIAETKAAHVVEDARGRGYPLQAVVEKDG